MYEDHMDGHMGHSNASLLASADEMAGNYTPRNDNNGFPILYKSPPRSVSRDSDDDHSSGTGDVELDYPMPEKPEIWQQAEHPDSINKLLNMTGDVCLETFRGAAKMLSHANPDTFLMPLEARFICMKVEKLEDMRYCLANGAVTGIRSCNERINKVWNERNGQRVFMMFSISGAKEFCAMAEMIGPSQPGGLPGWSKAGCEGIILITFIYVKNVPFALINHIKHKANGQPVANMWNSMMYHDNTGYHVARIYCEHPVLSSVLVNYRTEMQVNYKSQYRIPASGNSAYSASSYGSRNDKSHDPRSATRPQIYRSGDRARRSNNSRHAMHNLPWRENGIPPTPSHQPVHFVSGGVINTPTPGARQRRGTLQHGIASVTHSPPPPFSLTNTPYNTPGHTSNSTTPSFTTEDDRMLAQFASSRDAKRSDPSRTPRDFYPISATASDPFRDTRMVYGGHNNAQSQVAVAWHGANNGAQVRGQSQLYNAQYHGNGGAIHAPGSYGSPSAGLGITSVEDRIYSPSSQEPPRSNERVSHLPSPVTSSHRSNGTSSRSSETRGKQSPDFAFPAPPVPHASEVRRGHGHGHPAPQFTPGVAQSAFVNASYSGQQHVARPGSPIRHSQSMPVIMAQISHRLSAQHLRPSNNDAKSDDVETGVSGSPSIQDWVDRTPTHDVAPGSKRSPDMTLTLKASTDAFESPEKPVRSADLADKLKWHKAQAELMAIEIKMSHSSGFPIHEEKADLLKWHNAKVVCLEVEIAAAKKEHDSACSEVAHETAKRPTPSTGTPHNSAEWPSWTTNSSNESRFVTPQVDRHGKIDRSSSKNREGNATRTGQTIRHRRGDVHNGGFTGSFDARMNADIDNLISSPTRSNAVLATRTHGHPPQSAHMRATHDQYDSCTEDQHCDNDEGDDAFEFASQIGPVEDDDEVFSPRGRGYHHQPPLRDVSQMSYNGGIALKDGYGHK